MTKSSFAKTINISKAAVSQNLSKGKIKTNEEGLIDTDDPVNLAFMKYQESRKQVDPDRKRTGRPKGSKNGQRSIQRPIPKVDFSNGIFYPLTAQELSQQDGWENLAPVYKAAEDFEKRRLENAKKRGKVIDRKVIEKLFSKLFAVHQNQFLVSSDRIANMVAGLCGVNEDAKILELSNAVQTELYKTLAHIKRLIDDFLKGLEKND
jgi:hypothetical protein